MVQPGMIAIDKITDIFVLAQFDTIAEPAAQGVTIFG